LEAPAGELYGTAKMPVLFWPLRPMKPPRALALVIPALVAACSGGPPALWKMPAAPRAANPAVAWSSEGPDAGDAAAERGDMPEAGRAPRVGFWLTDEARAIGESRRSRRALLVDFSAEWCVPCMQLQTDTFSDEAVQTAIVGEYVPLRIDVTEESRANREQLRRYGIHGLPAVVLIDADGHEIDRIEQYLNPDAFLERLAAIRARAGVGRQAAAERRPQ
jgi:hypothetical protein